MNTGRLRNAITIQQSIVATGSSGASTKTWTVFATVFADIRTPTGKEYFGQDKFNSQVSHVVTIRWIEGVTPSMRIIWGSRTLNIEYVSEDRTNRRMLYLDCKEAVNG